ncbi:uncharacterized protein LOC127810587 [Diospyros lotus]|uniref:uncharacterized protein LOC127810587 n=1 Tax=Diospyros lotus TaxID=55363 RepID=UPI002254DAB4|nr:uncharacterized protein LOC127810587 [Diospyros lotus]
MDTEKARNPGRGRWTNERHMHYLSSMEASFVQTMFETTDRLLRLDRHVPDSSESTLDLMKDRGTHRYFPSADIRGERKRTDKKTRRPSSRSSSSSQDQVVPQLLIGECDKDARARPNVPAGTMDAPV